MSAAFGTPQAHESVSSSPTDRPSEVKPKSRRGFAAMDPKLVSEISRKGGKAAHTAGTAHEFTSEEAREAGRKGGRATHAKRKAQAEKRAQESGASPPTPSEGSTHNA